MPCKDGDIFLLRDILAVRLLDLIEAHLKATQDKGPVKLNQRVKICHLDLSILKLIASCDRCHA